MTDDKQLFDPAALAAQPRPLLPLADWSALPVTTRAADRLTEALLLASELRADLDRKEAVSLRWLVPHVDQVLARLGKILERLAS